MGYVRHTELQEPPDETKLWRYMDLGKYLDLLSTATLAMPKAAMMRDPYEGEVGNYNRALASSVAAGSDDALFSELYEGLERHRRLYRDFTFLSCWHAAEHESAGMWSQYADEDKGVAVVSTWGQLKASLATDADLFGGQVQYFDYDVTLISDDFGLPIYCSKRVSFEHEREVRLLVQDEEGLIARHGRPAKNRREAADRQHPLFRNSEAEGAIRVPIGLATLVDEVRVSPAAKPWFVRAVQNVTLKYGEDWDVAQSNLYRLH